MRLNKESGKLNITKEEWERIGEETGWIKEAIFLQENPTSFYDMVLIQTDNNDVINNLAKVYEKICQKGRVSATMIKKIYVYLIAEGFSHDEISKEIENMTNVSKDALRNKEEEMREFRNNFQFDQPQKPKPQKPKPQNRWWNAFNLF